MKATLILALAVLAVGSLPAQEKRTALDLLPRDTIALAWIDGPATLRTDFGKTRLGQLLGGPEVSAMFGGVLGMARTKAGAALSKIGIDAQQAEQDVLGYGGRITLALGADLDALQAALERGDEIDLEVARPWYVLLLSSDGHSDLESLIGLAADQAEQNHVQLTDLQVEGHVVRVGTEGDFVSTLPFVVGDYLMTAGGYDVEPVLSRCLAPGDKSLASRQPSLPESPIGLWADFGSAAKLLRVALEQDGNGDPEITDTLFALFGLNHLTEACIGVRPGGEHVLVGGSLLLDGDSDDLGLISAWTKAPRTAPAMLDLVPVQLARWSVMRCDMASLLDAVRDAADGLAGVTGHSWDDLEASFEQMFHVRLSDDLLVHLGDEILMLGAARAAGESGGADSRSADETGACYGFALKDAQSFGAALEKLIRSRGLQVARKTDDYRGFQVHRLPLLGGALTLHYSVTDRCVLVASDELGATALRAVLDEERSRADGHPRAPLPAEVSERLEQAIGHWQSISTTRLPDMLRQGIEQIRRAMAMQGRQLPMGEAIARGIDTFAQLAKRYKLETVVSVTASNKQSARTQTIW